MTTTWVQERIAVKLTGDGTSLDALSGLLRILGQVDRGCRIYAIEVIVEKPVRIRRSATTPLIPPSSPSSQQER